MSRSAWVDPRLSQVRAGQVRSYLLSRGWQPQPYPGPELLVFGGPVDDDGRPVLQVLPASERMRDFQPRLEELIAALSVMEDRPAQDVLSDILRTPADPRPPATTTDPSPTPAPK
jgi:hypothetical protein